MEFLQIVVGGVEEDDADYKAYEGRKEGVVYAHHCFEYVEAVPYAAPYEHEADNDIDVTDEVRRP